MSESKKSKLIERLSHFLLRGPENRTQLFELLKSSYEKNLMDADSLSMIEGVLQVSEMQVRDIMIPRSQMDVIDISHPLEKFIPFIIATAHSRFPVIEDDNNDVIGILLAKDLLKYYTGDNFEIRDMLRPAIFIPESKRLNVLLKEFRGSRNHIAIVVDEYGGVSGMVTIEDVLEQIVGEIEDEFDFDETEDNIIQDKNGLYRVKASTEIDDFNDFFKVNLSNEEFSTIGGLITHAFGHLPKRDEKITFQGFKITVLRADSRKLYSMLLEIDTPDNKV
jgi:magnesium and cobalt transporter